MFACFNALSESGDGDLNSKSCADPFFGKAITSRIELSHCNIIINLSIPSAMPP